MGTVAFQGTGVSIQPFVQAHTDQIKHQSSAALAFVKGTHRGLPTQRASNEENVPLDDVIIVSRLMGHLHGCTSTLQWRYNEQWRLKSPTYRLFAQPFVQAHIEQNIILRVTGLCERNPLVTGGFPSQRASNAEKVSIWWRHHGQWHKPERNGKIDRYNNVICCTCTRL